jgi:hypothetical protein
LTARSIFNRFLQVEVAYHSAGLGQFRRQIAATAV